MSSKSNHAMRGLRWTENYLPKDWFKSDITDLEEKFLEMAFMMEKRKERILWLAYRIALRGQWFQWNENLR